MKRETEKKGGGVRKTAGERREEILEAAISESLREAYEEHRQRTWPRGLAFRSLTSTGSSARRRISFSPPLGGSATASTRAFRQAAEANPGNTLEAMGRSYNLSLFRREDMLMLLQGFAVADDPEVGERYAGLWRFVEGVSGARQEEIWRFFATGMLLTVDAAIGLMPRLRKKTWLREFMSEGS